MTALAARRYLELATSPQVCEPFALHRGGPKRYALAQATLLPTAPVRSGESALPTLGEFLREVGGLTRAQWLTGLDLLPMSHSIEMVPGDRWLTGVRRTFPSGGGHYSTELYAATGEDGLHHYDPAGHRLECLDSGDSREALLASLADPPPHRPDLVLCMSTVFYRHAGAYGEMGYRIGCLDIGVHAAHVLTTARRRRWTARLHLRFADRAVDRLLGLDSLRESVQAVVTIDCPSSWSMGSSRRHRPRRRAGHSLGPGAGTAAAVPALDSGLPLTLTLHQASGIDRPVAVAPPARPPDWPAVTATVGLPRHDPVPRTRPARARHSPVRGFSARPLEAGQLGHVLRVVAASSLTGGETAPTALAGIFCGINRVVGVPPGVYRYGPDQHVLLRVGAGDRYKAFVHAALAPLAREGFRNAAAWLLPVGDYDHWLARHGDRGYRMHTMGGGAGAQVACEAAGDLGISARIHCDFLTGVADQILGIDATRAQSLLMVQIGHERPSGIRPQRLLR
jgi:SagB-type dehydrogenase family enzyme